MRKTDKKIDKHIRAVLTHVCEKALKDVSGFEWLTHSVDFAQYPKSLKVFFVFSTNLAMQEYLDSNNKNSLLQYLSDAFTELNIKTKNIQGHIFYDTEENCDTQHAGNWAIRLKSQ